MKFRYKKYGPGILRPVIPIEVSNNNRSVRYEALVDSGADLCIFDAQIGNLIGLDVMSGKPGLVSGITGAREEYFIHSIRISVGGWAHEIEVGFLPGFSSDGYGVVGQTGFFDLFVVKFDFLKAEIELKERGL